MIFNDFGIDTASLAGSLEGKLAAARQAGFSQVMISAVDIVGHPMGIDAGFRAVRASGLRVTGLKVLRDFEGLGSHLHAYKVDVAKSMLDVCSQLGGRTLLVEASTSTHADTDADVCARDLHKLAVLAIPMGIRIAFKGVPWSRTARDFRSAGEIVFRGDCPNLGVAIDAFDVLVANVPQDDLDAIDPEQIFLVQLSDYTWHEARSPGAETTPAIHFRVFPGEGAHSEDIARFVAKLDGIGYQGDYSFDVYNDDHLQMPTQAVMDRARCAAEWLTETVLRRALPVPNMERLRRSASS